jgi:hypothetical protein
VVSQIAGRLDLRIPTADVLAAGTQRRSQVVSIVALRRAIDDQHREHGRNLGGEVPSVVRQDGVVLESSR